MSFPDWLGAMFMFEAGVRMGQEEIIRRLEEEKRNRFEYLAAESDINRFETLPN